MKVTKIDGQRQTMTDRQRQDKPNRRRDSKKTCTEIETAKETETYGNDRNRLRGTDTDSDK